MLSNSSVFKNSLQTKCLLNICYRYYEEGIDFGSKVIVREKNLPPTKKSVHFARNTTDNLLFGSILKDDPFPKTIFPLLNPHKGHHFPTDSDDEILSISIFQDGYKNLPSVRNILEQTMPPERQMMLDAWKKKMTFKLGEEEFETYRQGLLDRGKNFHTCIELYLRKEEPSEEQLVGIENLWNSIKPILPQMTDVKLLESRVIHPGLEYQGSIDCVGIYKDMPVVIEFKTSSKPKVTVASTYDDPLQVAAYVGALNYDSSYNLPNINNAALVVAYATGLPAHIHVLKERDCLKYWKLWLQRLHHFQGLQRTDTSTK